MDKLRYVTETHGRRRSPAGSPRLRGFFHAPARRLGKTAETLGRGKVHHAAVWHNARLPPGILTSEYRAVSVVPSDGYATSAPRSNGPSGSPTPRCSLRGSLVQRQRRQLQNLHSPGSNPGRPTGPPHAKTCELVQGDDPTIREAPVIALSGRYANGKRSGLNPAARKGWEFEPPVFR